MEYDFFVYIYEFYYERVSDIGPITKNLQNFSVSKANSISRTKSLLIINAPITMKIKFL